MTSRIGTLTVMATLVLAFGAGCGEAPAPGQPPETVKTAPRPVRYLDFDSLSIGKYKFPGRVKIRRDDAFGALIVAENGIAALPVNRLPKDVAEALEKVDPPAGLPADLLPDSCARLAFFDSVNAGEFIDVLLLSLGFPLIGRSDYDLERSAPFVEYYWNLAPGRIFGVITENDCIREKLLLDAIPSGWH